MKRILACVLMVLAVSTVALSDQLVLLSPHRKSLQDEFVPLFKEYYKKTFSTEIQVDWLDQGGTSNDIRFLRSRFGAHPASAGVDVFWGGPSIHYMEIAKEGFLASYPLPAALAAEIPQSCSGIPLRDADSRWHASAISSFGFFVNKSVLKTYGLSEPKQWQDLASPKYLDQLSLADPRNSGTNSTINTIILQSLGWEKGWATLAAIAGNTRKFLSSSSDPVKAVETGDAAASMMIDFYGLAKMQELGADRVDFLLPVGQTILDSDPVALVKGAPNLKEAKRFIDFILSDRDIGS